MSPAPEVKKGFRARVAARLQAYLFRGLLVVVPLGISLYAVVFIYRFTAARLVPFVRPVAGELPDAAVVLAAVFLFLAALFVLGVVARAALGKRLIRLLELVLQKIPVVKTIYGAAKQVVETMSPGEEQVKYKAAVLVSFPTRNVFSLGFLTGKSHVEGVGDRVRVFVPTTPNPTSGYFVLYPAGNVYSSGISVEDAVKSALSGGILMPSDMDMRPISDVDALLPEVGAERDEDDPADPQPAMKLRRRARRLGRRVSVLVRNRLLSGLLLIVPIVITVMVIRFIYNISIGKLTPLAQSAFGDFPAQVVTVLSVAAFIAGVYLVGAVTTAFLGRKLVQMGEFFIEQLPLVKTIYGASKQMVEALTFQNAGETAKVPVLVPFPFRGAYCLGFLIGTARDAGGTVYQRVYLPTTPNITVGMLELYPEEDVLVCRMTVEDAVKAIVSGGILAPDRFETESVRMPGTRAEEDRGETP
ncbi:MAG: DUF502 domain-containing protein [Candidatus Hydrogenedentes bacterium]|nr:DUF502 domain-containing protein [Candidatus Hydrogenedentota bacterium]